MNSISASLNAATIAATARMLRSAKKEILLIVEGDDDIALFSHALGLPRSNFISCFGKERLMEVFAFVPRTGLDEGTIFIRDADCDEVGNREVDGVLLVTSDLYDFEMSLLPRRVFGRMFSEFMRTRAGEQVSTDAFDKLIQASSFIGALRFVSHRNGLSVDFKEAKFGFVDQRTLKVDIAEMIRYFLSRSQISMTASKDIFEEIQHISKNNAPSSVSCGKDFLKILSIALSRHYKCCNATECTFVTLSRMFRMTVTHDDIRELQLYPLLSEKVQQSGMAWTGFPL